MTDEQGLALARLMRDRPDARVEINRQPFDLPADYLEATFTTYAKAGEGERGAVRLAPRPYVASTFTCGIAPDGGVSS